ncbi:uncharacterized protein LOC128548229 [Mercenaria mercenaria]|uniref:uncharacterized protein LOC128548229 n=1 Tax=Mercenaria mercenaria TaxID=6596 RepID=UPI00234F554A|nr:uncharacterized protein LOC128548229 [Mercenaria mercenaria]
MPKSKKKSLRKLREEDSQRKQNFPSVSAECHSLHGSSVVHKNNVGTPLSAVDTPTASKIAVEAGFPTIHEESFHGLHPSSVLSGSVDIQVLDYYSQLLKTQFGLTYGLIPPSAVYQLQTSKEQKSLTQIVSKNTASVQMHFIDSHYVVKGVNPSDITIDQRTIRTHLKLCLESGVISDFPHKRNFMSTLLSNYFHDHTQKTRQKQRQLMTSTTLPSDSNITAQKTLKQKKWRNKQKQNNPELFKQKQVIEQQNRREKHVSANPIAAKSKRAMEQRQAREKQASVDPIAAKSKRAKEQKRAREKLAAIDPTAAKCNRAKEQRRARDKLATANPKAARSKMALQQRQTREKLASAHPIAAKTKRTKEQKQAREKLASAHPIAAKTKRAKEQKQAREKRAKSDPIAAKTKRAMEQKQAREKRASADPIAAKTKRAMEQKQAREKRASADPIAAKTKREMEQKRLREALANADPIAAKRKRANEQKQARDKLASANSQKAKQKRAAEQQTHRERQKKQLQDASRHFLNDIYQFPEFVCTCCSRMMYKKSVVSVHSASFKEADLQFLNNCLSHALSMDSTEWLCKTCLRYIKLKKLPPQTDENNLKIPPAPEELQDLTSLEERLIAQHYPFMKLIALPKERQSAIKGVVVNIPLEVDTVVKSLPRTPNQAGLLPFKLKRKIKYNGHYTFQYIRPERVMNALLWLKDNNPLYREIQLKDTWQQECLNEDTNTWNEITGNVNNDETTDTESVLSGESDGKKPIKILEDKQFEELSFPSLFPSGKFGYTYERPVKLSAKKYFQRRILKKGGKFAANIEYLFVAQFITEWQQILSSMSVALRKSLIGNCGENYSAGFFKNADHIRPLLTKDDAYRFLSPIRGSPPYWQKVMSELMAAIKQFQIFTWFLTLSAADMRWEDTFTAIARQQGRKLTREQILEMTWDERSTLLRSNPATAARHFHHKVQALFTNILLSQANTLGKITIYFYRIEFQQRGSPHVHAILWVENAPKPSDDSGKISNFVEQYVKANLPNEDEELLNLVESLQTHTHTATCKKKGGSCRFGYPKPISDLLILSRPDPDNDNPKKRRDAIQLLTQVKEFLEDETTDKDNFTTTDILQKCELPEVLYYEALKSATKTETIFLPRCPSETCINNYNPDILRLWKANMDLQYVTSPNAAIAYITSYITKDEREVGAVLQAVSKEMKSLNIKEQMKKAAFSFANARNVSAQEAAYRILGLPLYVSNFTTVWIPSGFPEKRIRILKPNQFLQSLDDDDEYIFCTNIIDRYSARPAEQLEHMCLAEFAMWYQVQSKDTSQDETDTDQFPQNANGDEASDEILQPVDTLHTNPNNQTVITRYGKMKRRAHPAVRYHQCSQSKDPDLYSYNRMLLFMPWKDEKTDLLANFPTYTEHYESRKNQIEDTFSTLMRFEDIVEQAITQIQDQGPLQHAWDQIAPETEHTQADLVEEGYVSDEDFAILNPDVNPTSVFTGTHDPSSIPVSTVEVIPDLLNEIDYRKLVQSLNFEQRSVFQCVLEWCHKILLPTDNSVDPLHIFVTGGAGTGKSHLIKAIHNMVCRELKVPGNEPSKPTILLMAPTGTAAFNIGGCTVHSSFLLPTKITEIYRKLSDSTCNQLRVQLCQLKVVVIDEISMVSLKAFNYIDKRLQQIKDSSQPFGGISVIAVGDLYQLRPFGKYVFDSFSDIMQNLAGLTWQELFTIFELKQIMRQKDDIEFASLLNRLRTGQHTSADIQTLQARNIDTTDSQYNPDALHIFSRNKRSDAHNNDRLKELQQPIISMTRRERRPAALKDFIVPDNPTHTGEISKTIELCKDARVMIIRNIDVTDGLVNGAQGTIVDFLPNSNQVQAILVKFDKETVGQAARQSFPINLSSYPRIVIPVKRVDVSFSPTPNKPGPEITWTQFPIRLSFSCTIHKVQGLSVDQLVVSFEDPFQGGQAYVALSRCRTLQGMQLLHFDPAKIKICKLVQKEMDRLRLNKKLPNPCNVLQEPLVPVPQLHHAEALSVCIAPTTTPLTIILIYRSPSVKWREFHYDLTSLLDSLNGVQNTIILGDFNEDALSRESQRASVLLERYGFVMTVRETTHTLGVCLDHIYLSPDLSKRYTSCSFHPVYYSDHFYGNLHLQWYC